MPLESDQVFPALTAPTAGGDELSLPDAMAGHWSVLLLYRGHWWVYCRQQLADFQSSLDDLAAIDTRVAALSSDDEASARKTVVRHALTFPVAYGLDPGETAALLGTYVNDEPRAINSTGFVLRPDATIELVVYSSGPIGRLVAADTIGLIKYRQKG